MTSISLREISRHMHPFARLMLLAAIMLVGLFAVLLLAMVIGIFFLDPGLKNLFGDDSESSMTLMRLVQTLTHIGLFIIPSLLFAWIMHRRPLVYLGGDKMPPALMSGYGILLMLAALPLVFIVSSWNEALHLPESLAGLEAWMRRSEEAATELTHRFLNVDNVGLLAFNLFMVAVIPSLGEEFIFRGILQRTLAEWSGKTHLAVWVTALIFSAMHMQFFSFLPRVLLGVWLGYMFAFTRNIWVPVIAHFFNNAAGVILYYLYFNGAIEVCPESYSPGTAVYLLALAALPLSVAVFWVMNKHGRLSADAQSSLIR